MNNIPATKTCTKCLINQPVTEFAIKRGSRAASCKACQRAFNKVHYQETRDKVLPAIRKRNKAVTAKRQPLVHALQDNLLCPVCCDGHRIWTKELMKAAREQSSEVKFRGLLEELPWQCRSGHHSGVAYVDASVWLACTIDHLMPVTEAFAVVQNATDISDDELFAALEVAVAGRTVFEPLPGWVQPI